MPRDINALSECETTRKRPRARSSASGRVVVFAARSGGGGRGSHHLGKVAEKLVDVDAVVREGLRAMGAGGRPSQRRQGERWAAGEGWRAVGWRTFAMSWRSMSSAYSPRRGGTADLSAGGCGCGSSSVPPWNSTIARQTSSKSTTSSVLP
eukprot:3008329-Prymnesium_polylepis.2